MNNYDPNFKSVKQFAIVGQKVVISNSLNQILLLKRSEKSGLGGSWSLPGGGLETGENSEKGIWREIEEETQLTVDYLKPFYVRTYLEGEDFTVIIAYRAKLRGGEVTLNWEHDDYQWLSKQQALELNLTPDAKDIIFHWSSYDQKPVSTAQDVLNLYSALEAIKIKVWLDGGWGIDALLQKQTRKHDDIDIVIQEKDVPKLRQFLEMKNYADVERDDTSAWNFVLADELGHIVDVHVIVFDSKGNGVYGPIENGNLYPANSLTGQGVINNQQVRCITAEQMVKFHTGYKLREHDYHDISAICDKFGIELPAEYQKLRKRYSTK